jgi:hypothetical protein
MLRGSEGTEAMEYVLLHYRGEPSDVVETTTTHDAAEAVEIARRWSRSTEDGVIVVVDNRPIVHCRPRAG